MWSDLVIQSAQVQSWDTAYLGTQLILGHSYDLGDFNVYGVQGLGFITYTYFDMSFAQKKNMLFGRNSANVRCKKRESSGSTVPVLYKGRSLVTNIVCSLYRFILVRLRRKL